jgi:restriction system protein
MMARRRKSKSLGEMGLTLLAIGVGVLLALSFLRSSPLTIMFEAFRPWAWLAVALGAFFLGLHALSSKRGSRLNWTPVEPVFGSRRTAPPRPADQPSGVLIDDDIRNRWRPPERAADGTVRPTVWTQAVFDRIEWRRFEALCESLLQHDGHITSSQAFGADGGIDIRLYSDSTKSQLTGIVQCKNWSGKKIGEVQIREFLGLKTDHRVATAIYVTSSTFMPAAQELASRHDLTLIDGSRLLRRIQAQPAEVQQHLLAIATDGDFWRATCVNCGSKMTLKTNSTNGTRFWACGRCRHTMPARQNEGVA